MITTELVTIFPLNEAFTFSVTDPDALPAVNWVEVPVDGLMLPRELFNDQAYVVELGHGPGAQDAFAVKPRPWLILRDAEFGVMATPVITGTTELVMVMPEVAVLETPSSWEVTVKLAAPALAPAVNTTEGPVVEERFPRVLLSTQL